MNQPEIDKPRTFWKHRRFGDERDFILATGPIALVTGLQHSFRDAMLLRIKRLLGERLPVRKLVDIGCAIGDWTLAYARNGFASEVVGLDLNAGFLALARQQAERLGVTPERLRFLEGDANSSDAIEGADLVCMGGFMQYLSTTEAAALLDRVAASQGPGGLIYVRTSCPPRDGSRPPDDYYRPRTWYEAQFARLGYRVLDTGISAAIATQAHAAVLGRGARALGRFAAWLHTRVIQRNRLEFVNWLLVHDA